MYWNEYVANGCNLLGDSYIPLPRSIFGPTQVCLSDSENTMGVMHSVGITTDRTVPYMLLFEAL